MVNLRRFSLSWICALLVYLVTVIEGGSIGRVRRNAFQMCSLINTYTGQSCLNFNPYGCFCGYGQQGVEPVDEADRCCKEHDDCYGEVQTRNHCNFWSGMFVGYNTICDINGCRCTDDEKCARKVCDCDLKLAICLGKSTFNPQYQYYDRRQCS